ncbi:MAG: hypothetical protein ACTSVO_15275 [Candidatus Heimdallarchaeaceae archaeon]
MTKVEQREINAREESCCSECGKTSFLTDEIRGEVVCRNCVVVNRGN